MTDAQGIISNIEHGFQKENPFYEHNYRLTLSKIENEFTRMSAIESKDFARLFRRYTNLVKAPIDFIMHIVRDALLHEKPRSSVESVKRSLGSDYTVAWCFDPKTEICILYTSIYHDGNQHDEPKKLSHGLLLQWRKWRLGKVERVSLGTGKRTSLLDSDSLFTTSTMKYSILQVSPRLEQHLERLAFAHRIRTLILDEVCNIGNWSPAANFLKHHTRDYQGVDSMFMDALLKERDLALKYIKPEDVTAVSKALISTMDTIIKGAGTRFISPEEFGLCKELTFGIIYGTTGSLFYTLWSVADQCYYFLEVNDTRNMVGLHRAERGSNLEQLTRIDIRTILKINAELLGTS